VTATNLETGVVTTTLTNETGIYNFPSLQPGAYRLSPSLAGFFTRPLDVQLASDAYVYPFTLPLASVVTDVEVPAMTMDAMMAASSQSAGSVLSGTMLRDMPTVGNDALSFVRMLPGVAMEADQLFGMMSNSTLTFAGVGQISLNTTRDGISVSDGRWNNGADASTRLNPDMVGEIRLLLSPVDAEFGRGNSQLQIQTRSGTNRYSGSAVWNIRNSALDANTWTNNSTVDPQTGQWKPTPPNWYNNHQYTLSYGGPIVKNKTFFFVLWDQQINYQRNLVTASVMTDPARQGIFRYFEGWNPGNALTPIPALPASATNGTYPSVDLAGNPIAPLVNPNGTPYTLGLRCFSVFGNVKFDGTPFTAADCPGGTALTNSGPWDPLRPVADPTGYIRKILDKMPPANYFGMGDGLNQAGYQWVRPRHGNQNGGFVLTGADPFTDRKQINVKIDENFNTNHRLSAGWSYERNDSEWFDTPNWPGALSNVTKRYPQVITANFTSVLSANLFNEARFGLRRQKADFTLPLESDRLREEAMRYTIAGSDGYFAVVSPGAGNYAFGGSVNGVMNATLNQFYGGNESPLYTYADALSWTMRKHAFKVGAELRFARSNGYDNQFFGPSRAGPSVLSYPRVSGGAGGNPSGLLMAAGLPNLLQTSRMNVSQMQYFLAGSVNNATMVYWIDDPSDVTNGTWEDVRTKGRWYRDERQDEWAVFWKDDWKVRHNLTLNIGLRYEYYGSPYISSGFASTPADLGDGLWGAFRSGGGGNPFERWLSPGNVYLTGYGPNVSAADALKCAPPACDPNTLTTIEFVGPNSTNPGKRVIPADRNNFAPGVGFAWRLPWFGEGKTTVRGGYQITYGGSFGATGSPIGFGTDVVIASAPGSASGASLQNYIGEFNGQYLDLRSVPLLVPVRPTTPAKPGRQLDIFASSGDFRAYDARYATPYVQNFNLSITRSLRSNLTLDLHYIGTVSRKQAGQIDLNTPNVYHNKELLEALEITRAGGNAPLFDQMLAGLNLNNNASGYGAVGTSVGGVLQTGSAHLRRNATFAPHLANGNFAEVATLLNGTGSTMPAVGAPGGLLNLPQGLTGVGGRLLRNGCDRIANGQTTVGPANSSPLRCFPENYIRANPQLLNSFLETNSASSSYHSMQAQIMLRPTGGTTLMGTYTWSKNLGIPGLILPAIGVAGPDYTDPSDRQGDYTFTNSHRAHDFRGNANFEVPVGPGRLLLGNSSGWLARLVEGWRTSFIFVLSSGTRADVSSSYLITGSASAFPTGLYGASVPDIVGPMPSHLQGHVQWNGDNNPSGTFHGGTYFGSPNTFIKVTDPQCAGVTTADNNLRDRCTLMAVAIRNADGSTGPIVLQNPKPGTRGDLGQKTIELPGTWSLDANLAKTFQISESGWIKSLQFRVDATNVLNHPSPGLPDLNINSSSPFGSITTKDGARAFQGQVRVNF
jgi:hypothetical protein